MPWMILLLGAIALVLFSQRLTEDVYRLASRLTGALSFLWGFSWAPPSVQLLIASVGSVILVMMRSR